MHPVDVCLHWNDLSNENVSILKKNNIKIRCAGPIFSNKFITRFYNILTNYNFTISNSLGSYIILSLDLNIPFSLVGKEPTFFNIKDRNIFEINNGKSRFKSSDAKRGREVYSLFKGINLKINKKQKKFLDDEKGKNEINSKILKKLIFKQILKTFYSIKGVMYFFKKIVIIMYFFTLRLKELKKELYFYDKFY